MFVEFVLFMSLWILMCFIFFKFLFFVLCLDVFWICLRKKLTNSIKWKFKKYFQNLLFLLWHPFVMYLQSSLPKCGIKKTIIVEVFLETWHADCRNKIHREASKWLPCMLVHQFYGIQCLGLYSIIMNI